MHRWVAEHFEINVCMYGGLLGILIESGFIESAESVMCLNVCLPL